MTSKRKIKSISRIDTHNTHGWYVRVRYEGREYRKLFSDNKHGNKLSALVEAKKYRDELEASLGKPRTERMVIASNKRNRSGMIGVRRREFPAFEVQACIKPGKIKKVIVPINKGNVEAAFKKACRLRQMMLLKSYNSEGQIDF